MIKQKVLTLLALLMTAVTGAWAQEQSETIATNQGQLEYTGQHVKVTATHLYDSGEIKLFRQGQQATIETLNGETIKSIVVTASVNLGNCTDVKTTAGNVQGGNPTTTITGINATSVILSCQYYVGISEITVYYTAAPAGYTVSMPQDTPDAEKWTAKAGTNGTYQQLPLEGVAQGAQVSLKYEGKKKVKSITIEKAAE